MKYPGIVFSILLLAGCTLFDRARPEVASNIEEELRLGMWEVLEPAGPQFQIRLSPVHPDCEDTRIHFQRTVENKTIFLQLLGISRSDMCDSIVDDPVTKIPINIQGGEYGFVLQVGDDLIHQGYLHMQDDNYRLHLNTQDGILIDHTTLQRVPKHVIWGYVDLSDTASGATGINFLYALDSITAIPELSDGYYGYFEIAKEDVFLHDPQPGDSRSIIFIRELTASEVTLSEFLNTWRTSHPEITILCKTWRGQSR